MDQGEAFPYYMEGNFAIMASRAKFQHNELKNTSIKTKAMEEVKSGLSKIVLDVEPSEMSANSDNDERRWTFESFQTLNEPLKISLI